MPTPVTPEEVGLSSTGLEDLRTVAQSYVDQEKLAGLITLIARQGKVAHCECYGMRDAEANKPMQSDTIFRIYSMTKPITCAAFLMLLEEGRVRLDDPVSKFIPEFKQMRVLVGNSDKGTELVDLEREMTIWHLLTHTAGLAYGVDAENSPVEDMYRAVGMWDSTWQLQLSLQDMVQDIAKLPLALQPSRDWRYSVAHDVIAYLVSVISDMPFDTFLEEKIFRPLGMDDTGFFVPEGKWDRFGALYSAPEEDGFRLLDAPATSPLLRPDKHPAGGTGLVSTVADYLRFAQMLLNEGEWEGVRLLSRESVQMMTTNQLPEALIPIHFENPWPGMGYGFGLGVVVDAAQAEMLWSNGTFQWLGIGGTTFWVDPQKELIGLIMAQTLSYFDQFTLRNLAYQAIVE